MAELTLEGIIEPDSVTAVVGGTPITLLRTGEYNGWAVYERANGTAISIDPINDTLSIGCADVPLKQVD